MVTKKTAELEQEEKAELVQADAQNRAWRTFLQGLGIDVLVAVALTISAILVSADGWGALEWAAISFSFVKSILQAFAAYVMRRFLDKTRAVPDKLTPPAESGE